MSRRSAGTRLERLLKQHEIRPSVLAREIHITRKHLYDVRMGRVEPSRATMATILFGVRKLTLDASIGIEDLFDLTSAKPVARRKAS